MVAQTIRSKIPKYYSEFISELLTELEGLRVELLEAIKWEKTPENKSKYNEIIYSKIFVEDILHRVDKKIRELEKNETKR